MERVFGSILLSKAQSNYSEAFFLVLATVYTGMAMLECKGYAKLIIDGASLFL